VYAPIDFGHDKAVFQGDSFAHGLFFDLLKHVFVESDDSSNIEVQFFIHRIISLAPVVCFFTRETRQLLPLDLVSNHAADNRTADGPDRTSSSQNSTGNTAYRSPNGRVFLLSGHVGATAKGHYRD
jgi:hypothetical protein